MAEALGQGGTSFDALYVNVNGESGYFDRSLHAYGREGEPCDRVRDADPAGRVHEPVVVLLPGLPAGRRGAGGGVRSQCRRRLTGGRRVGLLKTVPRPGLDHPTFRKASYSWPRR